MQQWREVFDRKRKKKSGTFRPPSFSLAFVFHLPSAEGFPGLPGAGACWPGTGIGVPGDAILDLQLSGQTEGTLSGKFTLNAKQLAALKLGHVYIQINSQKAPDGNLQGWLLPEHPFPGADVPEKGHGFLPQLDVPGNWSQK